MSEFNSKFGGGRARCQGFDTFLHTLIRHPCHFHKRVLALGIRQAVLSKNKNDRCSTQVGYSRCCRWPHITAVNPAQSEGYTEPANQI